MTQTAGRDLGANILGHLRLRWVRRTDFDPFMGYGTEQVPFYETSVIGKWLEDYGKLHSDSIVHSATFRYGSIITGHWPFLLGYLPL